MASPLRPAWLPVSAVPSYPTSLLIAPWESAPGFAWDSASGLAPVSVSLVNCALVLSRVAYCGKGVKKRAKSSFFLLTEMGLGYNISELKSGRV